jgi:DNA mismatch endonuclease (patch repair protein)
VNTKLHKPKVVKFKEEYGFYTTKARSEIMKKIPGKNTKPELKFRKALWSTGLRYRVNNRGLPGTPDISIKKYKLAVFIDGEFWHGHNWKEKKNKIKSNKGYWIPKIERNMVNDQNNNHLLEYMGYKVFRFWADEINKNLGNCIFQVLDYVCDFEKYRG